MQKYRVETIYENNMKDFVLLCNVLLHGQTIHGLGPEDIVQRVMLQAWEKKEKLEYHENLIGWFVVACSKECKALYRRAYTEHRNVGKVVELSENIVATPVQDSLLRWLSQTEAVEFLDELQNRLTPLEHSVYVEYYQNDKTAEETAAVLGVERSTVNDAARRIRKKAAAIPFYILILYIQTLFMKH